MRPGHACGRPVVVLAIGACLLLSGCSRTSQSELEKAKAAGASEQAAKQKQASVEADIQKLKEDLARAKAQAATPSAAATSPGQTQAPVAPVAPRAQTAQGASCGGNISVGANTSCAFAFNVASELYDAGGGSRTLSVYSPTTGKYYTMTCVAGVPTVCRGGNNAIVYIR
jgi:hypothetical protein